MRKNRRYRKMAAPRAEPVKTDDVFKSDAISFTNDIDPQDPDALSKRKRRRLRSHLDEPDISGGSVADEQSASDENMADEQFVSEESMSDKQPVSDEHFVPDEDTAPVFSESTRSIDPEDTHEQRLRSRRKRLVNRMYSLQKREGDDGRENHELIINRTKPFYMKQAADAARKVAKTAEEISGSQDSDGDEKDDNDAVKAAGFSVSTMDAAGEFATELGYRKYVKRKIQTEEEQRLERKKKQKAFQKKKIKADFAKPEKAGEVAEAVEDGAEAAETSSGFFNELFKKVREMAEDKTTIIIVVALFIVLILLVMTTVSSCGGMLAGGIATTVAGSFQSDPGEIDAADAAFTKREMELQKRIDNIETEFPGFDEYNYNLAEIGHDPFTLISYLSAKNIVFTAADVDSQIEELFNEMYELTIVERQETRKKKVKNDEGEEEEKEYTVDILDVTLTVKPLEEIVSAKLSGGAAQIYDAYGKSKGALQQFYTPLDLDWMSFISSYYGYRIDAISGQEQFHRGLDISVPEGTLVYAATTGMIDETGYDDHYGNYIVIKNADGFEVRYAHLGSISVIQGQEIRHGIMIGKTGRSGSANGSKLHIECLFNGEFFNPLFYFKNGNGSIYGEDHGDYPSDAVAALFEEAEKYLNYPYVWGGSSPATGFDCSGFVSYVVSHSGFYNIPRMTAQGLFNKCKKVSPQNARAGDLIFFTGTYNSGNPVSHVGIYAGNGQMIHCGDPIKYTSINTPYWQEHFFSYGRLPVGD